MPSAAHSSVIAIHADESCLGNGQEGDNPGGAGGLIEALDARTGLTVRRDYWIAEPATTNNRMALRSAIEGLQIIARRGEARTVLFVSDSRYLIDGMTRWVYDWSVRGWRRKTGTIENLQLWRDLVDVARPHRIAWRWVRGHRGHPQNEYANELATRAAAEQSSSGGAVPSGFDAWLLARQRRGAARTDPDPLPDPDSLAFSRPLPPDKKGSPPSQHTLL